jgi:hypothetical protein
VAAPSEAVTWKRIGVTDRRCRECGQPLVLGQVRRFGTDDRGRFVECGRCFDERSQAR